MRRTGLFLVLVCGCGSSSSDPETTIDGAPAALVDASPGTEVDSSPTDPDAGNIIGPDAAPLASISGTVWAPGNAPGMVPAGHEIPVSGALLQLTSDKPSPIPSHVYCEVCIEPTGSHTESNPDGTFNLPVILEGTYWLTIQKGQFRRLQQVDIVAGTALALTTEQTTLPSVNDYDNGMEIPRIAIGFGNFDHMEDILGKMGIGEVNEAGGFVGASADGNFGAYDNNGNHEQFTLGPLSDLLENYTQMKKYHIIFVPCASQTYSGGEGLAGAPEVVWRNLRQYVADGGKLYVTDWSGEHVDNIFPSQIRFAADHDTPPSAWDGNSWTSTDFADADGSPSYESHNAYAVDEDLFLWLDGQQGPLADGSGEGTFNAASLEVTGNWDHIEELVETQVGVDNEGFPVTDKPRTFIVGDQDGTPSNCDPSVGSCKPLTVTFEPAGCGRVLYSTYHTTEGGDHVGLVPQERILMYLIMEVSVCKSGPIVD